MPFEELKARSAEVWSSAPWERAAPLLAPLHDDLVRALDPQPGERWLDVGTGTGAVALRAAGAGADVTGVDLAAGLVETARRLAAEEGLPARFDVGDAEALPYEDGAFDVVSSAVGAIFAPNHRSVAGELARVVRPDGRLGLAAWRPETGFFPITRRYRPPLEPGQGDSDDWGREEYATELLGSGFALRFEEGVNRMTGASGEELWELLSASAGPFKALLDELDAAGRAKLQEEFVGLVERHRGDGGVRLPCLYILILGTRH